METPGSCCGNQKNKQDCNCRHAKGNCCHVGHQFQQPFLVVLQEPSPGLIYNRQVRIVGDELPISLTSLEQLPKQKRLSQNKVDRENQTRIWLVHST